MVVDDEVKQRLHEVTRSGENPVQCVFRKALETGAKVVQDLHPVRNIHAHFCAFHINASDFNRQVEAHHYCSQLPNGMHQCVIYDSPDPDARLIGIEYLITPEMYEALPDGEKQYWHSHVGEVKMGLLTMPQVPEAIAEGPLKHVMNMYGKIIHTWPVELGLDLPIGPPQLMVSYVDEAEVKPGLLAARDERYGTDTGTLAAGRADFQPETEVHPLADKPNRTGRGFATEFREVDVKRLNGDGPPAGR